MSVPLWVLELARTFWEQAEAAETFPAAITRMPILRALPITIVHLPDLHLSGVRAWLRDIGLVCPINEADRLLRACLVARFGDGVIFLDRDDEDDERRFSLAHELAHFLRHYDQPRQRAVTHFGKQILEVLDGTRLPTAEERLHALLRNVRVSMHLHLLARDEDRRVASPTVAAAETDADWLGCELLAPSDLVLTQTRRRTTGDSRREAERLLQATFGLPRSVAEWYAEQLYPRRNDPLLSRLGILS